VTIRKAQISPVSTNLTRLYERLFSNSSRFIVPEYQ